MIGPIPCVIPRYMVAFWQMKKICNKNIEDNVNKNNKNKIDNSGNNKNNEINGKITMITTIRVMPLTATDN